MVWGECVHGESVYLSYLSNPEANEMSALPSEVMSGWNGVVDGLGSTETSCHIPTAVPAAMAAPSTDISRKSGRTVCVCACVCVCVCMCACVCVLVN